MIRKVIMLSFMVVAALSLLVSTATAGAPTTISYQGRLTNAGGSPITDIDSVRFSIYSAASGGSALWTEKVTSLSLTDNGVFTVELGATTALDQTIFTGTKRYLGIKVNADAEMTPRQLLTSAPYSISTGAPVASQASGGFQFVTFKPGATTALAFATIASNGTKLNGTGNVSSAWNDTYDRYEITITGETYYFSDYVTVVTPFSAPCTWRVASVGGMLLIYFWSL